LVGLTAAAAGTSVVFGSGAFTQVEAGRDLTIGIDDDSDALIALEAGDNVASVYNDDEESGSGELVIDTDELGNDEEGFNVGATAQIGATDSDFPDDPEDADVDDTDFAFKLTNNFETVGGDEEDQIAVNIDLNDLSAGGSTLTLIGDVDGDVTKYVENGDDVTFNELENQDDIFFVIQLDTEDDGGEEFDGEITFTAEPEEEADFS